MPRPASGGDAPRSRRGYDLLALDLDGTLLDPQGRISEANIEAVRAARRAGMLVTVCTGRGPAECAAHVATIGQEEPIVVAGGSIIACPRTRRTLHRFSIDYRLVARAVDRMLAHGFPALVLKDSVEAGYEYLVVVGRERLVLDPTTAWWFEHMGVRARYAESLDDDEHPEHTVRFGACGWSGRMAALQADLSCCFGREAIVHHFPAVVAPDHRRHPEGEVMHVLEVFDRLATKWSAVEWLARRHSIDPSRVAAIGDEVNDVDIISRAGLGVAMGNAVPAVANVARRRTKRNDEDGVAYAIGKVLSGEW